MNLEEMTAAIEELIENTGGLDSILSCISD